MLADIRDVMIIIMSFMAIGVTVMIGVATIIIYRKISHTLDTARGVIADIKAVSSIMSKSVVKPTIKGASVMAGAKKIISVLSKHSQKKEEDSGKRE